MSKLSFYEFLLKQVGRDDPIGDLASDVSRENDCPKDSNKLANWHGYLSCRNACLGAKEALVEAFMEYEEQC